MILALLRGVLEIAEMKVIYDGVKKLPRRKKKPRGCMTFYVYRK